MRESIYNGVLALPALDATAISANGNTDGDSVGLDQGGADFRTACAVLLSDGVDDGTYTVVPQESANGSTGWTDVPAERLEGAGVIDAAGQVVQVGIIPDPAAAPFLRLRVTAAGVTDGGTVTGLLLLGSPGSTPIARP